jgi:hypothetical protein
VEGSPAAAGSPGAVGDSQVAADIPAAEEDSPAAADIPAAAEDSQVEEGSPWAVAGKLVAAGIRVAEGSPAVADNRVEAGIPGVVEDSPVEAGNLAAVASRRRSCRTWRKRCCPGPPGSGNWDRRLAEACRTRCNISVRGRYWRRTWGILSIVAFHLSITSITICKGKTIPIADV